MVRVAKGSSFALSSSKQTWDPQVKLVELFPVQIEWGGIWLGNLLSQGVVYAEIFYKFKARNYVLFKKSLSWKCLKGERALGENKIRACFFIVISIYSGDKILTSTELWSDSNGYYYFFQFLKSLRCDSISSLEGWCVLLHAQDQIWPGVEIRKEILWSYYAES